MKKQLKKIQSMKIQLLSSLVVVFIAAMVAPCVIAGDAAYNAAVLSEPSLFRYWTFDEFDGSGHVIDQTSPGDTNRAMEAVAGATLTAGGATAGGVSLGNAATADGTNLFRNVGEMGGANVAAPNIIEFWMRADEGDLGAGSVFRSDYLLNWTRNAISDSGANSPSVFFDFDDGPDGDGEDTLEIQSAGVRSDGGPVVSDSSWHHVVIANLGDGSDSFSADDGGTPVNRSEIYFDGSLVTTGSNPSFPRIFPRSSGVLFVLGADLLGDGGTTRNGFAGQMDEVAHYKFASVFETGSAVPLSEIEAALGDIVGHYNLVPEPSSLALAMLAMLGLSAVLRRH